MKQQTENGQRQETVFHGCDLRAVPAELFLRDDGSTGITASGNGRQTTTATLKDIHMIIKGKLRKFLSV